MRLLYSRSDEKFVRFDKKELKTNRSSCVESYKYLESPCLKQPSNDFDKDALPIIYKVSPDSLLNLAALVVDKLRLPSIYDWTVEDVCKWIRKYGYRHYQNTFRVNLITGRKLLLVDAQALASMNIKNFNDIKHIAYGIRQLFHFEMTKFMRSISLPPQYYYELYKLFRTQIVHSFDETRHTDLLRRMQILRERKPYLSHWDTLERWLARMREPTNEIIGGIPHYRLYWCKAAIKLTKPVSTRKEPTCTCAQECYSEGHHRFSTVFSLLLPTREPDNKIICRMRPCEKCIPPPCTCRWSSSNYKFGEILTCLKKEFPFKYDANGRRNFFTPRCSGFDANLSHVFRDINEFSNDFKRY